MDSILLFLTSLIIVIQELHSQKMSSLSSSVWSDDIPSLSCWCTLCRTCRRTWSTQLLCQCHYCCLFCIVGIASFHQDRLPKRFVYARHGRQGHHLAFCQPVSPPVSRYVCHVCGSSSRFLAVFNHRWWRLYFRKILARNYVPMENNCHKAKLIYRSLWNPRLTLTPEPEIW